MRKNAMMMIIAATAALILAGCEIFESVQTVEWYAAHEKETRERLGKCMSLNPPLWRSDASKKNCLNAIRADGIIREAKLRKLEEEHQ